MRYLPHTHKDIEHMLGVLGIEHIDDLLKSIPNSLRNISIDFPQAHAEADLMRYYTQMTGNEGQHCSFVGAGIYRHFVPAAVDALISRGEFLTSYTPYQAEISQGTLQAIFEFQTIVSELMGLEIANASMYDGASATAEAALMCLRLQKKRNLILSTAQLHPHYQASVQTHLRSIEAHIQSVPSHHGVCDLDALKNSLNQNVAALIVQQPNCLGLLEDMPSIAELCQRAGVKLVVTVPNIASLGVLASPGAYNADIAVGEGLGIGIPMGFGGPALGLFTAKKEYLRQMPGRLCGETVDASGKKGYVLTLSAREQHIRRERATSNICTNQGLNALAFTIHMSLLGSRGFEELATQCNKRARYLVERLQEIGIERLYTGPYFNEVTVNLGPNCAAAIQAGVDKNMAIGFDISRWHKQYQGGLLINIHELHSKDELDTLVDHLAEFKS
ncbi:MAG TPA: aminomethyl-transferring glycine dehydrogenase subunit GcvPA [Myxococcales bacterium]|nr:aminomethyl-transferring glycine dehydrogenase subunit GcvPA [Myxococcales bacterium]